MKHWYIAAPLLITIACGESFGSCSNGDGGVGGAEKPAATRELEQTVLPTTTNDSRPGSDRSVKAKPGVAATPEGPPYNYVRMVAEDGTEDRATEINGWLLLQTMIMKDLGRPLEPVHEKLLHDFGTERFAGWWVPRVMREGRSYRGAVAFTLLEPDIDDTAWNMKHLGTLLRTDELEPFFTSLPPAPPSDEVCRKLGIPFDKLLRTWQQPDESWRGEIDLPAIANALVIFDLSSARQRDFYEYNVKFVNHILVHDDPQRFTRYYERAVTSFLMLYYDDQRSYMTPAARKAALARWHEFRSDLESGRVAICWGGCEHPVVIEGRVHHYTNEAVPGLMLEYAKRWK